MKKFSWLLIVITLFSFTVADDEKAIRDVYDKYREALKVKDGEAAVNCLDKNTIAYYQRVADLIRTADSSKVSEQAILDKILILAIRHKATKQEITSFTGRSLFVYSIQSELTDASGTDNMELTNIKIKSDSAIAQVLYKEKPVPIYFTFYKEKGLWKMDLTRLLTFVENMMGEIIRRSGDEEDDAVMKMMRMMYEGDVITNSLWYPKK